ncbi:MAG: hypothetical protein AAFX81_03850 [Pseudomonadota bacterium]
MCFNKGCKSYRKSIRRDAIEGDFADLIRGLTPPAPRLRVARRMMAAIWDKRLAHVKEQAKLCARKIADIEKQTEGLVDRLVDADSKTVIAAYERHIAKLEQLVVTEKAASTGTPHRPFTQMFELAMRFLATPWKLWESGRFDLQRLVLKLTFSGPLPYDRNQGFRTPELSLPFKVLGGDFAGRCELAEGESASSGIRTVLCCAPTSSLRR